MSDASEKTTQSCPSAIIMLTSAGERGDAARCVRLGIAAYLLKPVKQAELLSTISQVLHDPSSGIDGPSLVTRHSIRETKHSLRVLLAEDNLVNQKLARRMLERMGHVVQVARNGEEALRLAEESVFDLILMDIQMPLLDGIEATKEIRLREKAQGGHTPIIAMTAYAMAGDKEKCMAAGMDGYVPKPINSQELFQRIEEVTAKYPGGVRSTDMSAAHAPAIGKNGILEQMGDDHEFLREIVDLFLTESPRLLTEVRLALEQGDSGRIERAAHSLNGCVSNFGAKGAQKAALLVETLGRLGDLERAPLAILDLEKEIALVREDLLNVQREIQP